MTVFGMGMARFDTGAGASLGEHVIRAVVEVLNLPVVTAALAVTPVRALPGLWGYLPFALNSLVWGLALTAAISRWQSARRTLARSHVMRVGTYVPAVREFLEDRAR